MQILGVARGGSRCLYVLAVTLALSSSLHAEIDWVTFDDQTPTRLVADPSVSTADPDEKDYAWGDVDLDGDTDLVCVRKEPFTTPGGRANVLFMNEGVADGQAIDGVLVDRTAQFVPQFADATNDRDVILVDVDGDGWLDAVTAPILGDDQPKEISHPRIYINQGDDEFGVWQGFVFETPNIRIPDFSIAPRFCGVASGDIDNDGDEDLYFVDYDQGEPARPLGVDLNDRLLINDGTGYFSDESETRMTAQMRDSRFGLNAQLVDLNGDGRLDIIKDTALVNPKEINVSYNNLAGTPGADGVFDDFENIYSLSPYHVGVGDLNNDTLPDLAISDHADDRYLLNLGNGEDGRADFLSYTFDFLDNYTFDDTFAGENVIADLDRDGFVDVVVSDVDANFIGCTRRTHFYRNLGNAPDVVMQDQGTLGIGPEALVGTHDIAVFDINGDDWLDLVVGRCGSMEVYVNLPPTGIGFQFPQGLPAFVDPEVDYVFQVEVISFTGEVLPAPGSATMSLAIEDGPFVPVALNQLSDNLYEATLPAADCLTRYSFFFSAQTLTNETVFSPPDAPATSYIAQVADGSDVVLRDEIEGDVSGWLVVSEGTTGGIWEQADPNATIFASQLASPEDDATSGDEDTMAFVTENGPVGGSANANDVDGGQTRLISPVIDLEAADATISFARWVYCNDAGDPDGDFLTVDVSNDDGASWTPVPGLSIDDSQQIWLPGSFLVSDYVAPTALVRVRFSIGDDPNNSVTEAGVDSFSVEKIICVPPSTPDCDGDTNQDGEVDPLDAGFVLARFGCDVGGIDPLCADADANRDGLVDPLDVGYVLARLGTCLPPPDNGNYNGSGSNIPPRPITTSTMWKPTTPD